MVGKSMIQINNRKRRSRRKRKNMKWDTLTVACKFLAFEGKHRKGTSGKEIARKRTRRDKKQLHHITINLMTVEMLFRRQKYRQFQQQQILYKLTAKESGKKSNMH